MQRLKNILVVSNGKTGMTSLLHRAINLAKSNRAKLSIVSILEGSLEIGSSETFGLYRIALKKLNRQLEQIEDRISKHEIQVKTKVLAGKAFIEIIREVLRENHDLVMISAPEEKGFGGRFSGSTVLRLMRKCPCPVWAMKPTKRRKFARILAAVDPVTGDAEKESLNNKILELGVSLAFRDKSELCIVHCWQPVSEGLVMGSRFRISKERLKELFQETRDMHRKYLDELLSQHSLSRVKYRVGLLKGDPSKVIPGYVRKRRIDLIVMGTVSRSGISGFLIGNTAEQILNQVDCSVLALKPEGFVSPIKIEP